ncbi:MAG: hypothetical protein ABJA34_10140 [Pseudonocardiales bacterium]
MEYNELFFTVERWQGMSSAGEPATCSELVWARCGQLPGDLVDNVAAALQAWAAREPFLITNRGR